jgi:hypothetical protein
MSVSTKLLSLALLAGVAACAQEDPLAVERSPSTLVAGEGAARLRGANASSGAELAALDLSRPGVTSFGSREAFSLATLFIAKSNEFEGYTERFFLPGDPWTIQGVTYTTTQNLIVGVFSGYSPPTAVFCNNFWSPMQGTVDSRYNTIAFHVGMLGTTSPVDLTITTSLSTYFWPSLAIPQWTAGGAFIGLIFLGPGEYVTSFHLASHQGSGSAPCIDNMRLGLFTP